MMDGPAGQGGEADPQVQALADLLRTARCAWVLTGAGVSTGSGLPDYRGVAGMWRNRRFEELASLQSLRSEPEAFWEFYRMRLDSLGDAAPNAVHRALARLQREGVIELVVTQNVDGLHQQAGSEGVLELHGSLRLARCRSCGAEFQMEEARSRWARASDSVPRCDCGAVLGPGVVLFGEALPLAIEHAFELACRCDVALALGTTLAVFPAAHLPLATVERGGRLAIVNQGATEFDQVADVRIDAPLEEVLPQVADLLLGPG